MSAIAIKAENISKLYRLGEISTGTLSHDLNRWLAKIRGKEDPFSQVGEVNDRTQKGSSNFVWSLKDVNFDVKRGESVGIVGKNGAGKSTLLKLLSRVTAPTSGSIRVRGRIASLLEVGTGFHPELTGKENIYLNGTILGMRKKEIDRKLDEIIDFSGVERYIETPVKRYSSGMYVRLAFAVAAYLESEILIVDEVLAVGDAEFQKKCLGKMKDVSSSEGRTVLFVSHNMGMVNQLCDSAVLMEHGKLISRGPTDQILSEYIQRQNIRVGESTLKDRYISGVSIVNKDDDEVTDFLTSEEVFIKLYFSADAISFPVTAGIAVLDANESKVFTTISNIPEPAKGVVCRIPVKTLAPGPFTIDVALFNGSMNILTYINSICPFAIIDGGTEFAAFEGKNYGKVFVDCKWKTL